MPKEFSKESRIVGYSDHTIGIDACKLAASKGATVIEKHFTLDKSHQKATESAHVCSMDWKELESLRKYCDNVSS